MTKWIRLWWCDRCQISIKLPNKTYKTSVSSFKCIQFSIYGKILFILIKYSLPVIKVEPRNVSGKTWGMNFLTWVLKLIYSMCMLLLICTISSFFTNERKLRLRCLNGVVHSVLLSPLIFRAPLPSLRDLHIFMLANISKLKLAELHLTLNKVSQKKISMFFTLFTSSLQLFHISFIYKTN